MKFCLKSSEWLNGVERFEFNDQEVDETEEKSGADQTGDESLSLMLEWKLRCEDDRGKCTTCECFIDFSDRSQIVEHYQSAWHRTNVKRKMKNLSPLDEENFDDCGNDNENESKDDVDHDYSNISSILLRTSRCYFVQNGYVFSIHRNILHTDENELSLHTFTRAFDCAIFLFNGGHFSGGIFENDRLAAHKSFHRYVARAKQGTAQSQYDKSNGPANSAGAALRRYNEQKMKEDILSLLASWKEKISRTPLIFIRCASYQRSVFHDAGIEKSDKRIRTIPFETKRPNVDELKRTWERLQEVEEHGRVDDFREEMKKIYEKKKSIMKVESGKRMNSWIEQLDKNIESDNSCLKVEEQRKGTSHLKQKQEEEKKVDQWPELSIEWRKEFYQCLRLDNINDVKNKLDSVGNKNQALDFLRNARFSPTNITFLHICASKGLLNCLDFLLRDISCDPTCKDETGKPPYSYSSDKKTKDVFITFRKEHPTKYTWARTHIPEPPKVVHLLPEEEIILAEKRKEKNQRKKEKMKAKKKEKAEEEAEQQDRAKWLQLSEREKRAIATERRIAGLPPIVRCEQCGVVIQSDCFQYSHFKFCTPACVAEHRRSH